MNFGDLGYGFWVMNLGVFGFWVLGFGFRVLGFGFWVLGFRIRIKSLKDLGCGL